MEADLELKKFREQAAVDKVIEIDADIDGDWEWTDGDHQILMLKGDEINAVERALQMAEGLKGKMPIIEELDGKLQIIHPDGETEFIVIPDGEELKEGMQVLHENLRFDLDDEKLMEELKALEEELARLHSEKGNFYIFNSDSEDGTEIIVLKKVTVTISELSKTDEVAGKLGLIEDKSLKMAQFSTYPNPNEGEFTLEFQPSNVNDPVEVRILDVMGKEVFYDVWNNPTTLYKHEINLRAQGKGLYILQIRQGEETVNRKLMIE